jgi:hypothetical protein
VSEHAPVELAPGLYRWTGRHPDATADQPAGPDDWDPVVGSVAFDTGEALALIDPLIPGEERDRFLDWLDRLVAGRPAPILTTIRWHSRDREALAERYASNSPRAWNALPRGVEQKPLRGAGETVYWLPAAACLVFGDRLLGDSAGGVRVCPDSWLTRERADRAGVARLMRPLLELPVERLLVSHGEPVLHDGRAALARAIGEAGGD